MGPVYVGLWLDFESTITGCCNFFVTGSLSHLKFLGSLLSVFIRCKLSQTSPSPCLHAPLHPGPSSEPSWRPFWGTRSPRLSWLGRTWDGRTPPLLGLDPTSRTQLGDLWHWPSVGISARKDSMSVLTRCTSILAKCCTCPGMEYPCFLHCSWTGGRNLVTKSYTFSSSGLPSWVSGNSSSMMKVLKCCSESYGISLNQC